DFVQAERFLGRFDEVASILRRRTTAGGDDAKQFDSVLAQYRRGLFQSAMQASTVEKFRVTKAFLRLLRRVSRSGPAGSIHAAKALSVALLKADLGRRPYHDYW